MAKLAVLAAVLVALLALAEASSYTVITTVQEENEKGQGQQSQQCRQEIQQFEQQKEHCERFLTQGRQFARAIINQQVPQQQPFLRCCEGLHEFSDEKCRCDSIEDLVRQQQQQRGGGSSRGQSTEQMVRKASLLPLFCGMGHVCNIQTPSI